MPCHASVMTIRHELPLSGDDNPSKRKAKKPELNCLCYAKVEVPSDQHVVFKTIILLALVMYFASASNLKQQTLVVNVNTPFTI